MGVHIHAYTCLYEHTYMHTHTYCDSTEFIEYSPTVEVVVDDGLGLRGSTEEGGSTGERKSHAA